MNYPRIKIDGIITTQSEMTVASGLLTEINQKTGSDKKNIHYTEICLDKDNNPYIPGSSLRGLLAGLSATFIKQQTDQKTQNNYTDYHRNLLGDQENKQAGKLRIYDATWNTKQPYKKGKQLHSHNSINPITGTAKDQHLFNDAFVAEQSQFNWQIEANDISEEETQYLYSLLTGLKKNPLVQIGKGQSKQQGLFDWQVADAKQPVQALTQKNFIEWLQSPSVEKPLYVPIDPTQQAIDLASNKLTPYALTFTALSPLLVNDPSRVSTEADAPKLEFYRNKDNQLIIPSSSLTGVLRHQCRKILLTLLIAHAEKKHQDDHSEENQAADKRLNTLFGHTGQQSKLWLKDAIAVNTEDFSHKQTFNAVDRFTGGVLDSALYTAQSAVPERIETTLYIDQRQSALEGWQKGLLILLIRDAMEADLTVGWGKAKGYGSIKLSQITQGSTVLNDWNATLQHDSLEHLQSWVNDLNDLCKPKLKQEQANG